jgi:lactose/L-arabinose transport system substrate-binding protein
MKKVLAWLVPLVAVGAVVTAQNSDPKGELTVWGWKGSLDGLRLLNDDFTKAYPNVKLNFVQRPAPETYQQLQLAVAAGSGAPDVTVVEDAVLPKFIELGAFSDISKQIEPLKRQLNRFKLSVASNNGKVYAMPWDSGPVALFYRRDVFEKAGVSPSSLKTWDDFYKAAVTIKAKTGAKMFPLSKARNDSRMFETFLWQQGIGYTDKAGAVILDKDPRISRTVDYFGKFFKEDLVADVESWTDPFYKVIAEGDVATLPMAVWMGGFLKSWIAPKTSGKWGVVPLPVWSGSTSRASNDGGSQVAILEQSKNKDLAWTYVKFILGRPESQLKMYEALDLFPSLESTYNNPVFKQPDPFYGNQNVRQVFAEVVKTVPQATVYSSDYQEINSLMSTELQKFALGQQSAKAALSSAAQKIRERTRRK